MIETWYLLKDGTYADPNECSVGEDGILRHEKGMEVAMRDNPNVPHTSSVDADEQRKGKKKPEQVPETIKAPTKAMVAEDDAEEPKRKYRTREMKAKG